MTRNNQEKKPTKILSLFSILLTEDITQLGKFLRSPYFGVSEPNLALFECLKLRKQNGILVHTTKKIIADKVFLSEPYSDRKVNNVISRLTKSIEQFLLQEEVKNNQRLTEKIKLEVLAKTSLYNKFGDLIKKTNKRLDQHPVKNATYYQDKISLNELKYIYPYKIPSAEKVNTPHVILKLTEQYNAFLQLQYHCELLNISNITTDDFHISRLSAKEKGIFKALIKSNPLAKIYFNTIKLAKSDSNQVVLFNLTKKLYTEINDKLSKAENRLISQHLLNYTTRQIDLGNENYKILQFDLYKISLHKNTIVIDNQMTHTTYLNIVVSALAQNEFQWTENFIQAYKNRLIASEQHNAYSFAMAYYYFSKKDLSLAYDKLKQIKASNKELKLRVKSLLLRTLYELNSTYNEKEDELEKHINNFKVFLNRHKKDYNSKKIKSYNNYVNFVEKLYLLNGQYIPKEKKRDLKEDLKNTPMIIARDWLFKMIQELK